MKLVVHSVLILLMLFLMSCNKDGAGVINNTSSNPNNEFYGPFGGSIDNDEVIPLASPYNPPLTTFEFEQLINNTPDNGTLILENDININYTLLIEKSITIKSMQKNKIIGKNLINLIQVNTNSVKFENLDFYLYNVENLTTSPLTLAGTPISTDFTLKNSSVYLSGKSSASFIINGLNLLNNSFFGLSSIERSISIVKVKGNNLIFKGNNIFDNSLHYQSGLEIDSVNNALIKSNIINSYAKKLYGAISILSSSNIELSNNSLYDQNNTRIKNDGYVIDSNYDGSIAISIFESSNVFNNESNKYYANHFLITDIGNNIGNGVNESSNINLNLFAYINDPLTPSKLFNNAQSLDWTPICLIDINPTISLSSNSDLNSYQLTNGQNLYYYGSIKPACL